MSLEQDIATLVQASNALTGVVDDKMQNIEERITDKETEVTEFLTDATPEKRYVQTLFIEGSTNFFYPVFWQFPDNSFGVGKLEISRHYSWEGEISKRPLDKTRGHQAALLLQIEGNAAPWNGDGNYLRVLKYQDRYNYTASHIQFGGYAHRRSIDADPPSYGKDGYNYIYSGIYLRGGGLTYRLSSNWKFEPVRLDNENDPNDVKVIMTHENTEFYIKPIPFSELVEPVEDE